MAALPNLFLVGAQKCGTTSMYRFLTLQDDISGPSLKEPNFLSLDSGINNFAWKISNRIYKHNRVFTINEYISLFDSEKELSKWRVDGSASYLYNPFTAKNIKNFNNESKVIILLKNPVDRAFSEFQMQKSIGKEPYSFNKSINLEISKGHEYMSPLDRRYIWHGRFELHLKPYLETFDRSQIHIDCVDFPGETMRDVFLRTMLFLDMPGPFFNLDQRENIGSEANFPKINNLLYWTGAKALISRTNSNSFKKIAKKAYYRPKTSFPSNEERKKLWSSGFFNVERVEKMTGLSLSHWKQDRDKAIKNS